MFKVWNKIMFSFTLKMKFVESFEKNLKIWKKFTFIKEAHFLDGFDIE